MPPRAQLRASACLVSSRALGPVMASLALGCVIASLALGCGAAALPEVPGRATHEDPAALSSPPAASLPAGTSGGLVTRGGRDQAHDVLLDVIDALLAADEARLESLFAERVGQIAVGPGGATAARAATDRSAILRQALAAARVARLTGSERLATLVEASSIEIVPLGDLATPPLPVDLLPTDLVVRFRTTPAGRRALAGIAPGGAGLLVVRPGAEPRVVAR